MCDLNRKETDLNSWYLQSRHEFIARTALKFLDRTPPLSRILDAGCGIGGIARNLRSPETRIYGCDTDVDAIENGIINKRLDEAKAANLCALPYSDNFFDLVVCSEVLEHIQNDGQALRELLRVSKGPVFLTVPAHGYLFTDSDRLLGHKRRYSRSDFERLLTESGAQFRPIRSFGVMPGLMILAYRFGLHRLTKSSKAKDDIPLATRFNMPEYADRILYWFSRAELALSRHGFIPWGHAWWTVARKSVI